MEAIRDLLFLIGENHQTIGGTSLALTLVVCFWLVPTARSFWLPVFLLTAAMFFSGIHGDLVRSEPNYSWSLVFQGLILVCGLLGCVLAMYQVLAYRVTYTRTLNRELRYMRDRFGPSAELAASRMIWELSNAKPRFRTGTTRSPGSENGGNGAPDEGDAQASVGPNVRRLRRPGA